MACILTSTILFGCATSKPETSAQKENSQQEVLVPVVLAQKADLSSSVSLTGEFEPFQEVEVMAKVSGYVREIRVDIGSKVRAGQVLAVLEVPELQDDLNRATASVAQSEAQVTAANDEVMRAESAHQIAGLSFRRLREVTKREPGLIAQQEIDEAQSRDLMTNAQLSSARSRLQVAKQQLEVSKAEASKQRTVHRYITITAPFSGTVTKRYANLGAMVQAGTASQSQAMPVVRLSQNELLRLRLPVPESMVPSVKIGAPVDVRVGALGRSFEGKVARYTGKLDAGTRSMITEVDVPNPTGIIVPGMFAEADLGISERKQVLSAPLEAIDRSAGEPRIYVVDGKGAVHIATVSLGMEDTHRIEIKQGIAEGDQIIVGQRSGLKEGQVVRAKLTELSVSRN